MFFSGILGLDNASYLADRIFSCLCKKGSNTAGFNDFIRYMNILLNGSDRERAQQSFDIFDLNGKGYLQKEDFENMIHGVSTLWNSLTGSKVIPKEEYIEKIFQNFHPNENGQVNLQGY